MAKDRGRNGMMRIAPALMLALTVLVRGLIPTGWMPSPVGGPLIICSAVVSAHARDHGQPDAPSKNAAHEVCVFAAAGTAPAPVLALDLRPTERATVSEAPVVVSSAATLATPRVREQSPRAPPLKV